MKKSKIDLKNPKIRNPLVVLLIAIGAVFVWYNSFYMDVKDQLEQAQKQVESKESEWRTIQALIPQQETLRKELVRAEAELDSLRAMFPDQREVPRLIRELSSVGLASRIVTTKFTPLPDVEQEYYIENRYNVAVAGMYHNLGEFFAFLANFPLVINLSSMIISANPGYEEAIKRDDPIEVFVPSVLATFEMTTFSSK